MLVISAPFALGGRGTDLLFGTDGNDFLSGGRGSDLLVGLGGHDDLFGGRGADLIFGGDGGDSIFGGRGRDVLFGGDGEDYISGGKGRDFIFGGNDADTIDGGRGADFIFGGSGSDTIITGKGRDTIAFAGDPFDGADVSAAGRQIVGNEDFVEDFNFRKDTYLFDGHDFDVGNHVNFVALDATDPHADIPDGSNVIVLLNSDNDNNPDTPFLAGTAAAQIAGLVEEDGAGFFVYFNSNLGLNRLVWSENLADASADLKIITRQTDLTGQDAIDALARFSADNFDFGDLGEMLTEDEDDYMPFTTAELGAIVETNPVVAETLDMAFVDEMPLIDMSADMWM
ncbi:MAG: calcium-binding protein [Pseudomonadota bacterium]